MAKDDISKIDQDIPGMNLGGKYSVNKAQIPQSNQEVKKEFDETKKDLDKLKDWILKKYKFTIALGVLPPQSIKLFIDEEEVPKQTEKHMHLYMVVPEDHFKKI